MTVKPDTLAALRFLERWLPGGPWVLTAIGPDKKFIQTRTFRSETLADLEKWLKKHNGQKNLYFHVNRCTRDLDKKAEREDVLSVDWFHVDIDPRIGEDVEKERERALSLLTDRLPEGVPAPTVVVFSGGGYQGFWKLVEPVPIDGDIEKAEDAKRYNQQLEILFGADNCHNIDRVMRLPGTINLPDAKKKKKGRTAALAELIEFAEERVYELDAFTAAPPVQLPEEKGWGGAASRVKISGNVDRLADIHALDEWEVPDRVKIIVVQGRHPDERKDRDDSRSAWVFDAVCGMVRKGVPDDVIYSVLTDPEFGISESVLEKGRNAQRYAARQIERAKEVAIDPYLERMNSRYAVILNMGGKCRVVEEIEDTFKNRSGEKISRTRLTKLSFEDLRNGWMNKFVETGVDAKGNPTYTPVGKWWLQHRERREFDTLIFAPGREVRGAYNMWRGFAVDARPGECDMFLDHCRTVICAGDDGHYDYLLKWMARGVQLPDTQGEAAVVLRGGRGTGKSVFARVYGSLFGRHFMQVSNPSHLVGNFNAHLRDVVVLFADEAFYAGDKKHTSVLKTLVTEDTITIEAKGVDVEQSPNYVHLIMASNDTHVIPAGPDERRFFVLDVADDHKRDTAYFAAMLAQMDDGGREALLHYLSSLDLEGFDVRAVPDTAALQEQKIYSLDPVEEWWLRKLDEGSTLDGGDDWMRTVANRDLVDDYVRYTDRFKMPRRSNETTVGKFIARVCPGAVRAQRRATVEVPTGDGFFAPKTRRVYFWDMPSLQACREHWERLYGPHDWLMEVDQKEIF